MCCGPVFVNANCLLPGSSGFVVWHADRAWTAREVTLQVAELIAVGALQCTPAASGTESLGVEQRQLTMLRLSVSNYRLGSIRRKLFALAKAEFSSVQMIRPKRTQHGRCRRSRSVAVIAVIAVSAP